MAKSMIAQKREPATKGTVIANNLADFYRFLYPNLPTYLPFSCRIDLWIES